MSLSSGVIFLAAGSSKRFGRGTPKQFLHLKGKPLFMRALTVFSQHASVREIAFVTQKVHFEFVRKWIRKIKSKSKIVLVEGGVFRGESVRNGLKTLSADLNVVMVHDSARPMVTKKIVIDVEKAAHAYGVALAAWPLPDTLKLAKEQLVRKTIPRKNLWVAQTPQGFRYSIAKACLLKPSKTATDDVELAERKGYRVALVAASSLNTKVTYPSDLKICQKLM